MDSEVLGQAKLGQRESQAQNITSVVQGLGLSVKGKTSYSLRSYSPLTQMERPRVLGGGRDLESGLPRVCFSVGAKKNYRADILVVVLKNVLQE